MIKIYQKEWPGIEFDFSRTAHWQLADADFSNTFYMSAAGLGRIKDGFLTAPYQKKYWIEGSIS